MGWMNQYDIDECLERVEQIEHHSGDEYPNLKRAAVTLKRLAAWVNSNSDGWPYWQAPAKAAAKLMDELDGMRRRFLDDQLRDLTDAELKALYRPIKTFLTKQGVSHEEVWPNPPPVVDLAAQPITLEEARVLFDGADPVGFRAITEVGPLCFEGCLARGSSPHSHSVVVGWQIVGPNGIVELNKDLMGVRSMTLHKFAEA